MARRISRSTLTPLRGTLDVLVLKSLSARPMHAYEINRWLEQQSRGQVSVENAATYQAIHRLERRQLINAKWGTTGNNRRARYFQMTREGRACFREESAALDAHLRALRLLLASRPRRPKL